MKNLLEKADAIAIVFSAIITLWVGLFLVWLVLPIKHAPAWWEWPVLLLLLAVFAMSAGMLIAFVEEIKRSYRDAKKDKAD